MTPALHARRLCIALAACTLLPGCASSPKPNLAAPAPPDHTQTMVSWLTGSFSSAAQAAENPEFRDIRLHIVRIWPERTDGPWLYVEQAAASAMDRPYRQRVYRVSRLDDQRCRSDVYEFVGDPLLFSGAWASPTPLKDASPANLKLKDGCHVVLAWTPANNDAGATGAFIGATEGRACPSSLSNAMYATSQVTLTPAGMLTWDRGYDAADQQVWGAAKGPYRFDRVSN